MQRLRYGPEINGYSTSLREGYQDVQLYLGGANRHGDDRRVASFEMHQISVQVTEQVACQKIISLWREHKRTELLQYLETLLFKALKQDPKYILEMLKEEFQKGVQEGRRQKASELRAVLMGD